MPEDGSRFSGPGPASFQGFKRFVPTARSAGSCENITGVVQTQNTYLEVAVHFSSYGLCLAFDPCNLDFW